MEQYINLFYEYVFPVLVSIGSCIVLVFLNSLLKKYNSKLDAETKLSLNSLISDVVIEGTSFAEQWGKNRQKQFQVKPTSNDKLLKATTYIVEELNKRGLTQLVEQDIKNRIEAYLGLSLVENSGIDKLNEIFNNPEENNDEDFYNNN